MRGALILIVFFSMFTVASLLIASPMFPGTVFCALIGEAAVEYAEYLGAVFSGVFYGAILWLVFTLISKRLEQQ